MQAVGDSIGSELASSSLLLAVYSQATRSSLKSTCQITL